MSNVKGVTAYLILAFGLAWLWQGVKGFKLPDNAVADSKWARAANVVMSVLLSGVLTGGANQSEVAVMTLTAAFSAGVWDLVAAVLAAKNKRLFVK